MAIEVCHLTSVHRPDDVRIFIKECQSLARAGFKVRLLFLGDGNTEYESHGVVMNPVNRRYSGRVGRILADSRRLVNTAIRLRPALVHLHDPELIRYASEFKSAGIKVVFDAHEDLPLQIMGKHYIPAFFRKPLSQLVSRLEHRYARYLNAVVAATPSIAEKFSTSVQRAVYVRNFPLVHELQSKATEGPGAVRSDICYIGGIMRSRGIFTLLDAIDQLPVRLHLCGIYSPESLRDELIRHPAWHKVIEHGFVGRDQVREVLSASRIGMVTLLPQVNYIDSLPIKLFEYMSAGIPVIASDFPLWKSIVSTADCGICVNPLDTKELATAIQKLLEDDELCRRLGENGREAVQQQYNWEMESRKLIELYSEILKGE